VEIDWQFVVSATVRQAILQGLRTTLVISLLSGIGALVLGTVAALLQISRTAWARSLGQAYVTVFRNVPLLVVLFFFYFGAPTLVGPQDLPLLYSGSFETHIAILVIALVSGAYMGEVIRAGLDAVPIGQSEAATTSGLTRLQTFRHIIVPQLGPIILPGMTNEAINLMKSTAYTMAIGVGELTLVGQQIEASTFKGFEAMTAVTLVYLSLSVLIFLSLAALERMVARK
jgi:His/Glu/Gln/Arg/opine family amino acid ABC transporter permease subunit